MNRRPDALNPQGVGSRAVADEWWFTFTLGAAIFVVVAGLALYIVLWRSRRPYVPGDETFDRSDSGKLSWIWLGGILLPAVVLSAVFAMSMRTTSVLANLGGEGDEVVVEVVGHRWWWDVAYPDEGIRTANEVYVPVGEPVEIHLGSADVIHSFWVPEIHPKLDMIPGDVNVLTIQADRPGIYRGLCAEFCGVQHARMQFMLVALPPEQFDQWLEDSAGPAGEPADEMAAEGAEVFDAAGCAFCHRVAGTDAGGTAGPDLTHVGSRRTLGAGILANNIGNLAGWIVDPHALKPGVLMPPADLEGEELQALLAYLRGLE